MATDSGTEAFHAAQATTVPPRAAARPGEPAKRKKRRSKILLLVVFVVVLLGDATCAFFLRRSVLVWRLLRYALTAWTMDESAVTAVETIDIYIPINVAGRSMASPTETMSTTAASTACICF